VTAHSSLIKNFESRYYVDTCLKTVEQFTILVVYAFHSDDLKL